MILIPIVLLEMATSLALASGLRPPVAVIEAVGGNLPGIQLMDYVETGQVITLGPNDTLVLGYLKSCWRETIAGGTVTVGTEQSEVQGGRIMRTKTPCDGGKMLLTARLANAAATGAAAFRAPPKKRQVAPHPEFTLYGLSPVIEVEPQGTLLIERVDQPGERHEFALGAEPLTHGTFLDLARIGVVLTAGGVYRAKAGNREMIFKIDAGAGSGETPLAGRLVRLQSN